ncbi:MAG: replicase [Perrunavirus faecadaptatum]|uniref:RNA-directed RNA polymerase n=1 Tax=Leviviridae sp. TaxID=2027243 RepID=A0ABY3SV70_9VIRU|nr:MAG: replicase [Leviviridae sp.]
MVTKYPSISRTSFRNPSCDASVIHRHLLAIAPATKPGDIAFSREGYLSHAFLSKYANPSPESVEMRRSAAVAKLLSTEKRNMRTINRLDKPSNIGGISSSRLLFTASRFIADLLGPFSYEVFALGGFSNGASTSRRRVTGDAISKFDGKGDVTLRARPYFDALLDLTPCWARSVTEQTFRLGRDPIRVVPGNVVFTVPKSDDIDRAAAKEPDINMFLQKSCGEFIRRRLRTVGIDLNDQSRNQELARRGSIDGSLATLDLSSASDSVTWKLVLELLPIDWFRVLSDIRSERGLVDGEWHEWATMSTMGNGFTFELESLIFWALARSAAYYFGTPGVISVYGDDIIVPSKLAKPLMSLLGYCGFIVNPDKSFWTGRFRESCGAHWFEGSEVTPFYCRKPLAGVQRLIWFLNQLRKWSACNGICDPRYEELYFYVHKLIPKGLRKHLRGGRDFGSINELVTPHEDGFYLHNKKKLRRRTTNPAFTAWLCDVARNRCPDSTPSLHLTVSETMSELGDYSLRPIPRYRSAWVPSGDIPVFLREL